LRIIGACRVADARADRLPLFRDWKKFMRFFNTMPVIAQQIAVAALDRSELSAALTRAHAGLAELRPPRSHSKQSSNGVD
jgi:hypothetical protein